MEPRHEELDASVDLSGKTALVTGGGRGIGRAIAVALGQSGARVGVLSRSVEQLDETVLKIAEAGGRAIAAVADVVDACAVSSAIGKVEDTLGPIDILVNNAGVIGPIKPFAETQIEDWWRSVEVNLRGPVLTTRAIVPGMISRGHGRIINIVTGMAPFAYFSSYAAGKTALVRFSESLAAETKPEGVMVFAMGPGTVRTAMSEHSLNSEDGKRWIPWFRNIFEEGLDLPIERPVRLALALASGRYDRLSGLTVDPFDDLDEIVRRLGQVEQEKFYSLRRRVFPNPAGDRLVAIREKGSKSAADGFTIERVLRAPRSQVYGNWIDAQAMSRWFIPEGGPSTWIAPPTIDARAGGRIEVNVLSEGETYHLVGIFTELSPFNKLAFRWTWGDDFPIEGGASDTMVEIEFHDQGNDTRVMLRQSGFVNQAGRDACIRGWNRCFDGMGQLAET